MDKVYVLIEGWRKDGCWHERISGVFAKEKNANAIAKKLEILHDITGKGDTYYVCVSEQMVNETGETRICPKRVQYRITSKKDGTLGEVELTPFYGDEQQVKFSPVFSRYTNGYFSGTIDFIPEEGREQHADRAMEVVKCSLDIIPKWVLDSRDGHDSKHLQGNY